MPWHIHRMVSTKLSWVCVYVCVCVCVSVSMHVCGCMCGCVYVWVWVCVCGCVSVGICVCMYVCMYVRLCVSRSLCHVCLYTCVWVWLKPLFLGIQFISIRFKRHSYIESFKRHYPAVIHFLPIRQGFRVSVVFGHNAKKIYAMIGNVALLVHHFPGCWSW